MVVNRGRHAGAWVYGTGVLAHKLVPELTGKYAYVHHTGKSDSREPDTSTHVSGRMRTAAHAAFKKDCRTFIYVDNILRSRALLQGGDPRFCDSIVSETTQLVMALKTASHLLIENKSPGQMILLCNAAGIGGRGEQAANATFTGAAIGMAKSAAKELARYDISVNMICYGAIRDIYEISISEAEQSLMDSSNLGKPVDLRSIADSIAYVSGMGAHLNGQVLRVDGGLYI